MKFALLLALLLAVSFTATASDRPSLASDDTSVCASLDSLSPSATPEVVVTPCCGLETDSGVTLSPAVSDSSSATEDAYDDVGVSDERCDSAPDIDELVQNCEIAYVFVLCEADRARPERYGSTSPSPFTDHSTSPTGTSTLHLRGSVRDLRHGPSFAAS